MIIIIICTLLGCVEELGVDMNFDELYEDYQKVNEAGLEIQRKDREKDRGR